MHPIKKFYLILGTAVLILSLIFIWQFRKTIGIEIKTKRTPLISEEIYNIPIEDTETPRGNPGAPLTIIEFIDFNCSKCQTIYNEINKLVDANPTKVRLFVKPTETNGLFFHNTKYANIAAYCANQQKRYWPFIDALMTKDKRWSEESIMTAANEAKLNIDSWKRCRENITSESAVNAYLQIAKNLAIDISPTIFINNKKIDPTAEINVIEIIKNFIR